MVKNPEVTVLMSVYNGEKYLRESIDSILNQTFKDFEFLIINDGSTDKTAEILKSYSDPRIEIMNNPKNIGLAKSLNKGLKIAKGKYIARQDADDISLFNRLEIESEFLDTHQEIGLVGTWFTVICDNGDEMINRCPNTKNALIKKTLLKKNQFAHGSVMFRKKCIEKTGFYRGEFKLSQDYDFWLRISENYKVANIPLYLHKWRFLYDSTSVKKKIKQEKYVKLAQKLARQRKIHGKDVLQNFNKEKFKNLISKIFNKSGIRRIKTSSRTYYYFGNLLSHTKNQKKEAQKLLLKALILNPFYLRTYRILARLFLPPTLVRVIKNIKRNLS